MTELLLTARATVDTSNVLGETPLVAAVGKLSARVGVVVLKVKCIHG